MFSFCLSFANFILVLLIKLLHAKKRFSWKGEFKSYLLRILRTLRKMLNICYVLNVLLEHSWSAAQPVTTGAFSVRVGMIKTRGKNKNAFMKEFTEFSVSSLNFDWEEILFFVELNSLYRLFLRFSGPKFNTFCKKFIAKRRPFLRNGKANCPLCENTKSFIKRNGSVSTKGFIIQVLAFHWNQAERSLKRFQPKYLHDIANVVTVSRTLIGFPLRKNRLNFRRQ